MRIPLSNVNLSDIEKRYARDALETGWISGTGDYVKLFETLLRQKVDRQCARVVSNGTVALEIALRALGIGPGDEVIVPALTFVSPAAAVRTVGAKPVFVDVSPDTWTIDPEWIPLSRQTKALIGVDLLGHLCNWHDLDNTLIGQDVFMIEDAAEAHGAVGQGRVAGSHAFISTFSFHANKTVTTGEGGAILTDDPDLAFEIRRLANHGMNDKRPYWHEVVGTNARMTNLTAAIGVGQMIRWDALVAARNQVATWYDERLADLFANTDLYRRPVADWCTEACWMYAIGSPQRQPIIDALRANGIDARAIWTALCNLPLYRESCRGEYPVAKKLSDEVFLLPTWAGLPENAVDEICTIIRETMRQKA